MRRRGAAYGGHLTRIVHIADLHFGAGHAYRPAGAWKGSGPSLAQAITDGLKGAGLRGSADYLVVSGDIFSKGKGGDESLAHAALQELTGLLDLDASSVLAVPGNHDLSRGGQHDDRFHLYDDLVTRLGMQGRTDELPLVVQAARGREGRAVAFVLLNSCRIEGRAMAGVGEVGDDQLRDAKERLDAQGVSPHTHVIVAVLHHHLLPITLRQHLYDPQKPEDGPVTLPTITVDAVTVLETLTEWGVSLVLHGHQHRPAIIQHQNLLHADAPVYAVAAGSCGAKETHGYARHFFVLDFDGAGVEATSLSTSTRNAVRFVRVAAETKRLRFAMGVSAAPPSLTSDSLCVEDSAARRVPRLAEPTRPDASDLQILFLSVTDCLAAREETRIAIKDLEGSTLWEELGRPPISLLGMYDLLGNWDLAIRLRVGPRGDPRRVGDYIGRCLLRKGVRRKTGRFSRQEFVTVRQEAPSLPALANNEAAPICHRRLGDTTEYERLRCQRTFLWIDLGSTAPDETLASLAAAVQTASLTGDIIESASRSDHTLLLETFASCSQSAEVGRLNRVIEPVLGPSGLQKYTLTCYGYDETSLFLS